MREGSKVSVPVTHVARVNFSIVPRSAVFLSTGIGIAYFGGGKQQAEDPEAEGLQARGGRRVLVTRKRGRKRFEDCDSIENSLRSRDPWGRIGWRQWKESFSLMTEPKWLPLIWPTLSSALRFTRYFFTTDAPNLIVPSSPRLLHFSRTRHCVYRVS